jgi:hypothetical protein
MSFAKQWTKKFCNEYYRQKIGYWWSELRNTSDKAWTYRMAELLRNLAQKMGYQMEYEITTDFSWYRKKSTSPSVAIEHENAYSNEIWKDEIPKLLESNAPLKVLITYVGKRDEETELINKFKKIHKRRLHEPLAKQTKEEFLFLINDLEISLGKWRWCIFYPTGKFLSSRQKPQKPLIN